MEPAYLDDRAVLAISGPHARDFLQGLVTSDVVNGLAPGTGLYTALLSPQGKILFDFLVTEGDGALLLDVSRDRSDALIKKLKMYKLRAKVEIEARDPLGVYVSLKGHPDNRFVPYADRAVSFADPRLAALGTRSIGACAEMPANLPGPRNYAQIPELAQRGQQRVQDFFATLEERLQGRDFIATDRLSVADITAVVAVDFARVVKVKPGEQHPNLQRWRAAMAQRPAMAL